MSKKNAHFDFIISKSQNVQEGPISPPVNDPAMPQNSGIWLPCDTATLSQNSILGYNAGKTFKTCKAYSWHQKMNQNLLTLKPYS